jgi:hypothetical protein
VVSPDSVRRWNAEFESSPPESDPPRELPGGLVERPLSLEDLAQLVEEEFDGAPPVPGSNRFLRSVSGKSKTYIVNVAHGAVHRYCISLEDQRPGAIAAITVKYLIEANEKLFRRVANDDRTTRDGGADLL